MSVINRKIWFVLLCLWSGVSSVSSAEMPYGEAVAADRKQQLLKYAFAAHDMVDSVAAIGNKAGFQVL
ncbi:MAG: hypothetical protein LBJ13_02305 [Puniceicoccales bacterium]|jgi:hypothetical protein|nr:hypothetical protein [Puniceicoccales bacterium]